MTTSPSAPGSTDRVIRDLLEIPTAVHDGDLVVKLTDSAEKRQAKAIADYVVTPRLAENFNEALELIRSAVVDNTSQAAYLHGSFGAGKSHFLSVLSAVLEHHPDARGKEGLGNVIAAHDPWLADKKFVEVKAHMTDKTVSVEAHILGGYVRQVRAQFPDAPVPAVYRAGGLLEDARNQRAEMGDDAFIASLPVRADDGAGEDGDDAWGELGGPSTWTPDTLDRAFAADPDSEELGERNLREELVSALLDGPFKRYADSIGQSGNAYLGIDEGLSVISRHAREHLGCDGIIMLLDELILRFTAFINDEGRIAGELQKISKLVESSYSRPVPVISFLPRQRDLRDLVGLGGGTEGITRTIDYWEDRFKDIFLADANLTEVVSRRLVKPRSAEAAAEIDQAFERMRGSRAEVKDTLLDSQGGAETSTWEDFRKLYPFSPALLHVMVEMSHALSRSRSSIKLLLQLLVDHRDTLPVGQMVPLGAVFDVLIGGENKPFKDHLSGEYTKISNFYRNKVRPWLLGKHGYTNVEQTADLDVRSPFRREDLLVKTLLLSALTPNVPALRDLTAGRAIALNQGLVRSRRPGQDVKAVTQFFKDLQAEFGEVRVGAQSDNPTISLNLLRVDTGSLMRSAFSAVNDHALRGLVKRLLWKELGLEAGAERTTVVWRGTQRPVELVYGNVRSSDDVGREDFRPLAENAVRIVFDYPFDSGDHSPADDRQRVQALREEFTEPVAALAWLPTFLAPNRLEDARKILQMEYLLQNGVIEEKAPDWNSDDRREAWLQLDNQRHQLTVRIRGLLRGAYGLVEADGTDYGATAATHIEPLMPNLSIPLEAGSQFPEALERVSFKLLDALYPEHPDLSSSTGRTAVRRADLSTVLNAVEAAKGNALERYDDVPKADLPVLRRIAVPLRIAAVTEVFVLQDEWRREIDRFIARRRVTSADVRVAEIKEWIRARQDGHGLPEDVVDLLVQVYAVQSDRAWIRAGKRFTGVGFGQLAGDIVLRRQELPAEEDFHRANDRAELLFQLPSQPLRSARAVQNLAGQLKEQAHRLQHGSERLVGELLKHADVLGVDEQAPRVATARTVDGLLGRLAGLTDDTELVNALGRADLPEEAGVYRAAMIGATNVADSLAAAHWKLLGSLEGIVEEGGAKAAQARDILDQLREAARHNELSHKLANALRQANSEAVDLLARNVTPDATAERAAAGHGTGTREHEPVTGTGAGLPDMPPTRREPAHTWVTVPHSADLDAAVAELRSSLGISPEAPIQITIREAE
ncbi:phage resistance protein [Nocardiopsis sp. HNM0947]|uniref:Phage resistance protein n=1 Tax=Nocardiopsis coralli TaxID=2772213 RepID=A0ABR9P1G5_9ACTN|nr:DUF6079 family protein [Nocardiopsis coralli]MBE2997691.1 phage resistance protein [Nocardiopsis coralli]